MLPDRVSNPGPLTYESGALPIALHGPATEFPQSKIEMCAHFKSNKFFPLSLALASECI